MVEGDLISNIAQLGGIVAGTLLKGGLDALPLVAATTIGGVVPVTLAVITLAGIVAVPLIGALATPVLVPLALSLLATLGLV